MFNKSKAKAMGSSAPAEISLVKLIAGRFKLGNNEDGDVLMWAPTSENTVPRCGVQLSFLNTYGKIV
jgi:hypothetical protein